MKILIADDKAQRYGRLIEALAALGIARNAIEIASCSNDAKERLTNSHYDLLILDILLPLWPESDPDIQHSLDLLFEISENPELHKPGHILGITADRTVAEKVSAEFAARTWTVVDFSESNDEWIKRSLNCIKYIQAEANEEASARPKYGIDLAIICALEKPELEEVLRLPWNWSPSRPINDTTFVRDGYFELSGRKVSVCATFAPRMGMVSTALLSATVISHLRPRLLVMCGICAGVKDKVNYGDVLLADPAWDFQSGKRVRDKENTKFSMSPHHLCAPTFVRTHVEQIRGDKESLANIALQYTGDLQDVPIPKIVIGPVASGSAVLADGEVINEIKNQHRELIGVEMEIYGMYAAAHLASKPQPLTFALKAVCDFADPDKEDKYQRYAAYTSANVLRLLMERFGLRLLD